jgi:hypothetical protein
MAIRLTPERLRRLVLEEKAKMTAKAEKKHALDPKAKKEMYTEMDEESWHDAKPPAAKSYKPGDKPMGAGATMKEMRELRAQEEMLRNRLQKLQERRLAIRRKIISELE